MTKPDANAIEQITSIVKAYTREELMDRFLRQMQLDAHAVEQRLEEVLSTATIDGETCRPARLLDAMRYGVFNGGKRFRPFLVIQSGALFGANRINLLQVAAALECVHCYSLIHDDLPAMDDDDLRRGRPTVHKKFDEASAILAGDGLLTYAFDLLSDEAAHEDAQIRIALISALSKAAGIGGMAGGQMLDLHPQSTTPTLDDIGRMQAMKTGALIKFACEAGALCGGASPTQMAVFTTYGEALGRAFQLADDILDVTGSQQQLGKGTSKDRDKGKQTQITTIGLEAARQMADELVANACDALSIFGPRAQMLENAAHFAVQRMR